MNQRRNGLEQWLEDLRDSGKLVIVEGPNDQRALEHFAIPNVVVMNNGKPISQMVEEISGNYRGYEGVIILTDLDRKGREHYRRLKREFSERGVEVDNHFREFLFSTRLTHIEGLVGYLERRSA